MSNVKFYKGSSIPTVSEMEDGALYFNINNKTIYMNMNNNIVSYVCTDHRYMSVDSDGVLCLTEHSSSYEEGAVYTATISGDTLSRTISFTYGMTWRDYIASDTDSGQIWIGDDGNGSGEEIYLYCGSFADINLNGVPQKPDDLIVPNASYYSSEVDSGY